MASKGPLTLGALAPVCQFACAGFSFSVHVALPDAPHEQVTFLAKLSCFAIIVLAEVEVFLLQILRQ